MRYKALFIVILIIALGRGIAHSREKMSLQLRWHHGGQFAGYYIAEEKGFYSDANLDVSFIEGGVEVDHIDHVLKEKSQCGEGASEAYGI